MSTTISSYPAIQKEPAKNKKNVVQYGLCASIPAIAGLTHGVYKKIDNTKTNIIEDIKLSPADKFVRVKGAMLSIPGSGDAISIADNPNDKVIRKVLIDNKVKIGKAQPHPKTNLDFFINCLTKLGFSPDKEKIMTFVNKYGIDKLNKDIKDYFGVDFHITFEKGQGRDKPSYKIVHIEEIETRLKPPKRTVQTVQTETSFFQKILNPYDEKALSKIEKLPFGKKFANFMRNTDAPIKRFSLKPLRKFYYDRTSMLKGAGVAGVLGLTICAAVKGVCSIVESKKQDVK